MSNPPSQSQSPNSLCSQFLPSNPLSLCPLHACVLNCFSHVRLFVTPWTVVHQAPLSVGFSRQEYWGGLPCPPPGDLPRPGIEPAALTSPALAGRFLTTGVTWEALPLSVCVLISSYKHTRQMRLGSTLAASF